MAKKENINLEIEEVVEETKIDVTAFKKSVVAALSTLKTNGIAPTSISGAPVDELSPEDFEKIPAALKKLGLEITNVKYKKPIKGKLARGVKFSFEANGMKFSKVLDIEFKKNKEQVLIANFSEENVSLNPDTLKNSPFVLEDGSTKHFIIDEEYFGFVSIYDFKFKNNHSEKQIEITLKVRTRNPEYKPNVKGAKPYYEKSITFMSEEFKFTDVDFKRRLVGKIVEITSKKDAPSQKVSEFEIDTKSLEDLGVELIELRAENIDAAGREFDYNTSKVRVKLVVLAFASEIETDVFIKFRRSYNENVLINFSEANLELQGFENVISNNDKKVNEEYIIENLKSDKDVVLNFVENGLLADPANKRNIQLSLRVTCGEYHTLITTEANLGLGNIKIMDIPPTVAEMFIDEPELIDETDELIEKPIKKTKRGKKAEAKEEKVPSVPIETTEEIETTPPVVEKPFPKIEPEPVIEPAPKPKVERIIKRTTVPVNVEPEEGPEEEEDVFAIPVLGEDDIDDNEQIVHLSPKAKKKAKKKALKKK